MDKEIQGGCLLPSKSSHFCFSFSKKVREPRHEKFQNQAFFVKKEYWNAFLKSDYSALHIFAFILKKLNHLIIRISLEKVQRSIHHFATFYTNGIFSHKKSSTRFQLKCSMSFTTAFAMELVFFDEILASVLYMVLSRNGVAMGIYEMTGTFQ